MDRSRSKQTLAHGVREAFADLFAINTKANDLDAEEIKNKLRTLYAGKKTDLVIGNIAKTFKALCEYADFVTPTPLAESPSAKPASEGKPHKPEDAAKSASPDKPGGTFGKITVSGLQYHINIVLPDTRDQAVYDAIFKSLREHLA